MLLRGRVFPVLILLSALMSCQLPTDPVQGLFIARFSPDSVDGGELDTLYGYGFGTREDSVTAMLGSVKLQTVLAKELMLVVRVPEAAETAKLTVTRGGLSAESKTELVVRHSTRVSSKGMIPRVAPRGAQVTIWGTGFEAVRDSLTVLIANITAPIDSVLDDHITFTVPPTAYSGNVTVLVGTLPIYWYQPFTVSRAVSWREVTIEMSGESSRAQYGRRGWENYHSVNIDTTWYAPAQLQLKDSLTLGQDYLAVTATGFSWTSTFDESIDGIQRTVRGTLSWDTVHNTAHFEGRIYHLNHYTLPLSLEDDYYLDMGGTASFMGSPDRESTLTIPFQFRQSNQGNWGYSHLEADHQGEYSRYVGVSSTTNESTGYMTVTFR